MNNTIEPHSILKITHRSFDQLVLEAGFSSFSQGFNYQLRQLKQNIAEVGWIGMLVLLGGLTPIARVISEAWQEDPMQGWILLAMIGLSIVMTIVLVITSYAFAESWTFDRANDRLTWTRKFLLGTRHKPYRLEQFVDVAILEPKTSDHNYALVLARPGKRLFKARNPLQLMAICSSKYPHRQQRLLIYQQLAQEIAEFMDWPIAAQTLANNEEIGIE